MSHLGSTALNQEMIGHVHNNSNNLLSLNYQLEHTGNLTIDLGASSNTQNSQNSTNLTTTSNSPSSLNDKSSTNNHLHRSHIQHSSNQLNHSQYNQLNHQHQQSLINSNSVSLFTANQCEQSHNQQQLLQHGGSPIMDLNSSYNQTNGSTSNRNSVVQVSNGSNSNSTANRLTPTTNEEVQQTVIKSENNPVSVYSINGDEYLQQADNQLNCNDNYRTDIVKIENAENCSVGNNLNNVTVSYTTSGYNGYDQLQMGNLSTQLILHPSSSPLLNQIGNTHLQNALNNHNLHHHQQPTNLHLVTSSPSITCLHHSVIVDNDSNQQSPTSKTNSSVSNGENENSNYNLTLMTAAAVTHCTNSSNSLQPLLQVNAGSSSESFGLPPSKRSRRPASDQQASTPNNNFTNLHSIELEDDHHLHQSNLNATSHQLHSQHLHQLHPSVQHLQQPNNSQMSVDFNLCSAENQSWGDEYNYIYIPKLN